MRRLSRKLSAYMHDEGVQVALQHVTRKLAHIIWLWRVAEAKLTVRIVDLQTMYNNTEVESARLREVLHDVSVRGGAFEAGNRLVHLCLIVCGLFAMSAQDKLSQETPARRLLLQRYLAAVQPATRTPARAVDLSYACVGDDGIPDVVTAVVALCNGWVSCDDGGVCVDLRGNALSDDGLLCVVDAVTQQRLLRACTIDLRANCVTVDGIETAVKALLVSPGVHSVEHDDGGRIIVRVRNSSGSSSSSSSIAVVTSLPALERPAR